MCAGSIIQCQSHSFVNHVCMKIYIHNLYSLLLTFLLQWTYYFNMEYEKPRAWESSWRMRLKKTVLILSASESFTMFCKPYVHAWKKWTQARGQIAVEKKISIDIPTCIYNPPVCRNWCSPLQVDGISANKSMKMQRWIFHSLLRWNFENYNDNGQS